MIISVAILRYCMIADICRSITISQAVPGTLSSPFMVVANQMQRAKRTIQVGIVMYVTARGYRVKERQRINMAHSAEMANP